VLLFNSPLPLSAKEEVDANKSIFPTRMFLEYRGRQSSSNGPLQNPIYSVIARRAFCAR
jgi:hypothetical protein